MRFEARKKLGYFPLPTGRRFTDSAVPQVSCFVDHCARSVRRRRRCHCDYYGWIERDPVWH
jgi:hypothetical protein